jgi:predicted Zn-dependent peptidase
MIAAKHHLKAVKNKHLHEQRHEGVLSCGMKLLYAPRPGFTKKIAFVVADYGSADSGWEQGGKTTHVPDGIAHFLEHQVFKKERGDLSDFFAARGAYINAHTGHTQTAYFFECVEQFEPNLDNLLELVLTPFFDKRLVDTERQIIIQEINQYLDQPGWVNYQQLMEALYVNHPIRIDIAGSAESVSAIDPEWLHRCHATFYHPTNLTLVVSGDFEAAELFDMADRLADKWAPKGKAPRVQRLKPVEPGKVRQHRMSRHMLISRQRLLMGFKDTGRLEGRRLAKLDVLSSLGLDAMFSKESELYERLYGRRLIAGDFGAGYQAEHGFGYAAIGGETPDARTLETEIMREIKRVLAQGIDAEVLERKRRKYLGKFLQAFNEPEGTAYAYIGAMAQRSELFLVPHMIENATVHQVNERLRELLTPENYAISLILPQR